MTGAAYLCSKAALRSGAGIVTLAVPESLNSIMEIKLTCCMTRPFPETEERTFSEEGKEMLQEFSENFDVVAMGPGISQHPSTKRLVIWLLQMLSKPIVLDADGINALGDEQYVLERTTEDIVVTPHPGEMARLCGLESAEAVQKNRVKTAMRFAEKRDIVLVLKGHETLVTDAERIYVNSTGNPGMATAGVGDVLTGMIAGLMAQRLAAFDAAQLGVYLHGLAGDIARQKKGDLSLIAMDVIDALPRAFNVYAAERFKEQQKPAPKRPQGDTKPAAGKAQKPVRVIRVQDPPSKGEARPRPSQPTQAPAEAGRVEVADEAVEPQPNQPPSDGDARSHGKRGGEKSEPSEPA